MGVKSAQGITEDSSITGAQGIHTGLCRGAMTTKNGIIITTTEG